MPASVRKCAAKIGATAKDRLEEIPGFDQFERLLGAALEGLIEWGRRLAVASLRRTNVVRAYKDAGHHVAALEDIQKLELRDVDKVKPRLAPAYITAATMEGAGAGFVVSGGELLAMGGAAGAGAGAAPGAATVVGTMTADAAAVLLAGHRALAHIAAYYGYDVEKPHEQLFALGVLGVGTATEVGKAAAFVELNKVVQGLARRQTWKQLNQHGAARIVAQVYKVLGMRITQQKLGQAIPIVGIVIGAGLNARLLTRITDAAEILYRERFLSEKYGIQVVVDVPQHDDDTLGLADIIDVELVDDTRAGVGPDDASSTQPDSDNDDRSEGAA
jgi:hypothetical protein